MNTSPLVVTRIYDAPVSRVWQALTDINQIRQWYFQILEFRAEPGFEFSFEGGSEQETYVHHCRITAVIPERLLKNSWRYENYEGSSEVSWELFPEGDKTRLVLTHSGLESFPDKPDFAISSFTQGWNYILEKSLGDFLKKEAQD